MNRQMIATELLRIAKSLTAAPHVPLRRDVDVNKRNTEALSSLTTYAPSLSKKLKNAMSDSLKKQGFDVDGNDLNRVWSQYLVYIDPANNNNKYHYYGVYSFDDDTGDTLYVAANCSGRIGMIERSFDLTLKNNRGPAGSEATAQSAAEKHMNPKIRKGYKKVKMTRG